MKLGPQLLALALAATGSMMMIGAASAQTRTWVSGVGDDVNPCSRTAPCKTFPGAISKTATGGEINCLDPAGYGAVNITKSITIDCGHTHGSILSANVNGIIVNGANINVTIRGISINAAYTTTGNGIRYIQGASLTVEDVDIRNFGGSGANGHGIRVENSTGIAKLTVVNSTIVNNGNGIGGGGGGIQIAPTGAGSAEVSIDNTQLTGNTIGVRADATATSGNIDVAISRSIATRAAFHGFVAIGGATGKTRMILDGVVASNNGGEGIRVVNSNGNVRIGRSTVSYNGTGIALVSGGLLRSCGDNFIDGNTDDGPPPVTSPQK